ncbi:MAG: major facilitator superfamily 1 [Solirubrobacterales bacterium]|nr:major facilitator superfamily 1 [Solirubrobacterales bacterium]
MREGADACRGGKRLLAVLCAVAFLDFVDASITNVALPHIRAALGFSGQTLQWVPSAYLLTYLPLTFAVGISSGVGAKLLPKLGSRAVISAGALITSGGLLLLAQVPVHGSYLANILPGLMLFALGVGPVFVGVTTAANAGATADRAGLVAAILNSAQQIGGALGLAIFSALATSRTNHLLATGASVHTAATAGFHRALLAGAIFAAAAALISLRTANTREDPMEAGHPAAAGDTTATPAPAAESSSASIGI